MIEKEPAQEKFSIPPENKKKRKITLIAFGAAVLIFLIGASILAYYFVIMRPHVVLVERALTKFFEASSFHFKLDITTELKDVPEVEGGDTGVYKGILEGDIAGWNSGNSRIALAGEFTVTSQSVLSKAIAGGEARIFDLERLYGRLTKFNWPIMHSSDAERSNLIQPHMNEWILLGLNDFLQEELDRKIETIQGPLFTKEEFARLADHASKMIISEKIGTEKIDGVSTWRYRAKLKPEQYQSFIFEFGKILLVDKFKIISLEELYREIRTITLGEEFAKEFNAEVWIGQGDSFVRKIIFTHQDDSSNSKIIILFSKFNEPVTIEEPKEVIPFNQVKDIFFGQLPSDKKTPEEERRIRDSGKKSELFMFGPGLLSQYKDGAGVYPSTGGKLLKMRQNDPETRAFCNKLELGEFEEKAGFLPSTGICPSTSFFSGPNDFFGYKSNGTFYELTAVLEDSNDPECIIEGGICIFRIRNDKVVSKK